MEAIYSEEEIISLQGQSWWVACNENPFLVKAIIHHTTILLSKRSFLCSDHRFKESLGNKNR